MARPCSPTFGRPPEGGLTVSGGWACGAATLRTGGRLDRPHGGDEPSVTDISQRQNQEANVPAKGSAEWKGDLRSGAGTFTAGETISGEYSFKSRFEDGPGANPEQLIAGAHASCFSMALANMLAEAGTPADSIRTDATVTLRPVDGVPTITAIALVTEGRVPGLDAAAFEQHAAAAKAGCPVSRALAAVPEVTLEATLAS
jgi:osmotically inducible protein OsmC